MIITLDRGKSRGLLAANGVTCFRGLRVPLLNVVVNDLGVVQSSGYNVWIVAYAMLYHDHAQNWFFYSFHFFIVHLVLLVLCLESVELLLWFTYEISHLSANSSLFTASIRAAVLRTLGAGPDRLTNGTL